MSFVRGLFLTLLLIGLLAGGSALAQLNPLDSGQCGALGINCSSGNTAGDLRAYGLLVIYAFLTLVGIIAVIFVIIGGVRYIGSQGDEQQAEQAKKTVLYAVIGLVIVGLAFVIVNFTGDAVGVPTGLPGGNNLRSSALIIINAFLILVALVALIFLIIGGVRYIGSQGDDQQAEQAKKTILHAVVGLVVIGLAAALVNFVIESIWQA